MFLRFIFLFIGLISIYSNSEAKRLPGSIITENSDTIVGTVKMYLFNRITGNLIINGIDLELYHYEVSFKSHDSKGFKTYKPQDILGFTFIYKAEKYIFHRFIIEYKSIVKNERKRYRFLNLLYRDKVSLYSDLIRVNNSGNLKDTHDLTKPVSYKYNEYYLFNNFIGLNKVEVTNNVSSTFELLKLYGIEEKFLYSHIEMLNVKNIKEVFKEYYSWSKKKNSKKLKRNLAQ